MSTSSNPLFKTVRQSLAELGALIQSQKTLLASEPNSFAYQLGVRSLELRREELLNQEPEPSSRPFIAYAKNVIERLLSESRFFSNTLKDAFLHPLSTSAIDKRTGKVVKQQARVDQIDMSERLR
jgi:hypothetical protein